MPPMFATSHDGTRIAYDSIGKGPPLVLLHGGFVYDRRSWADVGYVDRLKGSFRLLAVDLRGHGESGHPTAVESYDAARLCEDVLAVMNEERVEWASVWGFSFGASVALQLAISSARVDRVVLGGAALGRWLTDEDVQKSLVGITLLSDAKRRGTIDELPVPEAQKRFAREADLDVAAAMFRAMVAWPIVEPEALRCPGLFYAGAENATGIAVLKERESRLLAVGARWTVLEGLDHKGEFTAVDRALPPCEGFLREG